MELTIVQDFSYFISHQKELVEKYRGKFIVIKNDQVISVFDDEIEAIIETQKSYPLGSFLVQQCEEKIKSQYHFVLTPAKQEFLN